MTAQEALNAPVTYAAVLHLIAALAVAWSIWWTCIAVLALVLRAWRALDRSIQKWIAGTTVYWVAASTLLAQTEDDFLTFPLVNLVRGGALALSYIALRALVPRLVGQIRKLKEHYREVAR